MVTFRYTIPPSQEIQIQPFTSTSTENLNKCSRLILFPFLKLSDNKIPNIVTPGGYGNRTTSSSSECFYASFSGHILTLGPGYCLVNEELFEIKNNLFLDLRSSSYYADDIDLSNNKVYIMAYFNPEKILSSEYGLRIDFSDPYSAYIVFITNPLTFYYNQSKFCFLYCISVTLSAGQVDTILSVSYRDPDISYMRRKIYDTNTI